jgi:O-antigen/teichoic acid export membrane protein
MLAGREVIIQLIGFATNVVTARLLAPAYFGITTLGLTIVSAANIMADAGVGASLISRKETPSSEELSALSGLQLLVTGTFSAIAIPIGFSLGGDGPATAIILLALPLYSLRTAPLLLLERRLEVAPRILIQVAELITYGIVAIALALAGLGVWAMPIALVVRTAAGTLVARHVSPIKRFRPNLRFGLLKPVFAFGVRFQLRTISQLVRDLTLVSLIGSFGGFRDLGYYGFCYRLLTVPQLVATVLGELSMPAFSRLRESGEDIRALLNRATAAVALVSALLIAPLVAGSAGLVPFLFGHRWKDASLILPGAALALIIAGPLGVTVVGYLYAIGDAKTPLRANIVNGVLTVAFTVLFLKLVGIAGVGIGSAVGSVVATPVMLIGVVRGGGPRMWPAFIGPTVGSAAGMAIGWWLCGLLDDTIWAAFVASAACFSLQIAVAWVFDREALRTALRSMRQAGAVLFPRLWFNRGVAEQATVTVEE